MDLTPEDVDEILAAIDGTDVDELVLETGRFRMTLRRVRGGWTRSDEALAEPVVERLPEAEADAPAPPSPEEQRTENNDLHEVLAPLPGTFYRASEPGAPPMVEVGDRVDAHTVIGLLETMKLFNSIDAGVNGTVAEICVGNGEAAHQGAVLARVAVDG
jgi:acetyl-CoA carboxylase biotin carboxyl carrier protein